MRLVGGFFVLLVLVSNSFAETSWKHCSAQNSDPNSVGDYVPTSVQAEKNRLMAQIQDWREDLRLATKHKKIVCMTGSVEGWMYSREVSQQSSDVDIRYLKSILSEMDPRLTRILKQMSLTSNELDAYSKLQKQELDMTSCAMEVRHAIDSRLFIMSVLLRVFKDQIDYHTAQMGHLKDFQESCVIRQKRQERDRAMIAAGNQLIEWYDLLEKAN